MNIQEVKIVITDLKRKFGKLYSNIIWTDLTLHEIVEIYENEKGLVFVIAEEKRNKIFYAVTDISILKELLMQIQRTAVLEYHYKDINDMDDVFLVAGLIHYANYIRVTSTYLEKPCWGGSKRQDMLNELYNPDCGEYPVLEDVEELDQLTRTNFDPLIDDVFSLEEWKNIIQNKECFVIKENGKIVTYYVWRREGKKLYSNMSLNLGPANYMYNLERRVFETMWNEGIRTFYAWYNEENTRAIKRGIFPECARNNCIHDAIYINKKSE